MLVAAGRTLPDGLTVPRPSSNSSSLEAGACYLAKTHVTSIKLMGVPKQPNLNVGVRDLDGFDPFTALGIGPTRRASRSGTPTSRTPRPITRTTTQRPSCRPK